MPTGIGLLFLVAGLYCTLRRPDWLFGLLLFSAIFPATSAITFGSLWIMPYYVLAPLFVVSQFLRRPDSASGTKFSGQTLLLALGSFGLMSALFFPVLFTGVQVYSARLGSSDEVFQTFPLVFSVANIAQAAYLLMNILVVFAAASVRGKASIWGALNGAFYVLTGTIVSQLLCLLLGISFPYKLIENNPERASTTISVVDIAARLRGTCGEPSYAGLILVIFFAAYFYRYYTGRGGGWKAFVAVVTIGLARSSSAFLALVAIGVLIIVLNPPFRFPGFMRAQRAVKLIPVSFAILGCLLSPTFFLLLQEWVIDKPTSGSYSHRTTMDQYSVYLLMRTFGMGVGVGSYRPSSLVASLLGNVGLIGTTLAALFVLQIALQVPSEKVWVRWALAAGLIDMALAIPDITQPILWCMFAVAVYVGTPVKPTVPSYDVLPVGRLHESL